MKFKLSMLFALIVICIAAVLKRPERIRPYPYQFSDNSPLEIKNDVNILLIGDRLGVKLGEFKGILQSEISRNLTKPIEIEDLSAKGDGLHRSLHKIKRIKKLPKVILYHGGTEEFFEKRYERQFLKDSVENIKRYLDTKNQSVLYILPSFSKILYKDTPLVQLGPSVVEHPDKQEASPLSTQLEYLLFELELDELIRYVKSQNSLLILLTTPINLTTPPNSACSAVDTELNRKVLNQVKDLMNSKDYKGAYGKLLINKNIASAHAEYFYLKGLAEKKLSKLRFAKSSFENAAAFDCMKKRGDPVFNRIIKKYAAKHNLYIFDFEKLVYNEWGENVLFFDEVYPQNLYYERATSALAKVIKKILKL